MITFGAVLLFYGALGAWVKRHPPVRKRPGTVLAAYADARVSTFQRLSRPLLAAGAVLIALGAAILVVQLL